MKRYKSVLVWFERGQTEAAVSVGRGGAPGEVGGREAPP